jgi:putative ABC transport system substrate-binding protein
MGRCTRRFVASLLGFALLSALLVGCGGDDEPPVHTVAILRSVAGSAGEDAFGPALAKLGFAPSQLRVLGHDTHEVYATEDAAKAAVRDWVRQGAELILALSTSAALAATDAAPHTPVLFLSSDPVGTGLVKDVRHPDGNRTGVGYRVPADRFLAIAEDAFGDLTRIGCVYAGDDPASAPPLADLRRGATALGMTLHCEQFSGPADARRAVDAALADGSQVLVVPSAAKTAATFPQLAVDFADVKVPVITTTAAEFAVVTLQPDSKEIYRQLARQAARLLRGATPSQVPVEDPGHYLLVVNERVAERIGRAIPADVLARADQVIR